MIGSVWELAGFSPEVSDYFAGWAPKPDSPILGLMEDVYVEPYGVEPSVGPSTPDLNAARSPAGIPTWT